MNPKYNPSSFLRRLLSDRNEINSKNIFFIIYLTLHFIFFLNFFCSYLLFSFPGEILLKISESSLISPFLYIPKYHFLYLLLKFISTWFLLKNSPCNIVKLAFFSVFNILMICTYIAFPALKRRPRVRLISTINQS